MRSKIRQSPSALSPVRAEGAFSFLKEMKGESTWLLRDLAGTLKLTLPEAKQVASVLEIQGYAKQFRGNEWMTTISGEQVSGAKTPRFTPENVEEALSALGGRIAAANKDPKSAFTIAEAFAFGDFLDKRTRAQAADVGIRLERRRQEGLASTEREFLKQLRNKSQMINLVRFAEWMAARKHRALIRSKA
ncbi:MAG TPA: hypothetical protein VN862_06565 [Candidatus Acidoferrales bacterium]|nr:hypothetical protein [Candidatus Acidoferrales bacterium]